MGRESCLIFLLSQPQLSHNSTQHYITKVWFDMKMTPPSTTTKNSMSEISQLLLTQFGPNIKSRFNSRTTTTTCYLLLTRFLLNSSGSFLESTTTRTAASNSTTTTTKTNKLGLSCAKHQLADDDLDFFEFGENLKFDDPPPLYLIWEKFEIGKTLNFRNPPSNMEHKLKTLKIA